MNVRFRLGMRRVLAVLGFVAATVATLLGLEAWIERAGVPGRFPGLVAVVEMQKAAWRLRVRPLGSRTRIVFLGDSTVQGYPEGEDVADEFRRALKRARPGEFDVGSLAQPGMGPLDFFSLAEMILSTRPDRLVISFNLSSLSPFARDFWARRELVGWIPIRRLGVALELPLLWWNITFDRLLLYESLRGLGLRNEWIAYRGRQLRAGNAITALRRHLQQIESPDVDPLPPSPSPSHPDFPNRFSEPLVRMNLGEAATGVSSDHPVLQMLGAAIDVFRARGVEVTVYATPANVEHYERVGIDTRDGIATTIDTVRELAKRHGAQFVDLHRLFPDAAFRDSGNHLFYEGDVDGPRVIAGRLVDAYLLSSHERHRGRRR